MLQGARPGLFMLLPPEPTRLPLAQLPTPLQPLDRLSEALGGPRIWLKRDDLTGALLTGNKVRKLEFLLADAREKGADTLVTCGGIQSNHCRATAFAAAQTGFKCHLILRGRRPVTSDGNLLLDELAGATISFHSPAEWPQLAQIFDRVINSYLHQGLSPYLIPTGGSNGMGLWGYIRAARELSEDWRGLGFEPELVSVATGSGGTHLGLALGLQACAPAVQVRGYAVCDDRQYFLNKAAHDLAQWRSRFNAGLAGADLALNVVDEYVGPGYGVADQPVYQMIRQLAQTEGILLDPVYTGKAFYGLTQQIKSGELAPMQNVVFVHTGGVFGVFPHRKALSGH